MRKILFSLIVLAALTFEAGAQWLRPAREIRVETNGWTYIPTSKTNAQLVINWLDAELGLLRITGGFSVLPDTNNLQVVLDWIDDNWNTNDVPTMTFLADSYLKGTNIFAATYNPTTKTWTVNASGVNVSTNLWTVLQPADTNAQSALDAIDDWMNYANSNLNVASVAGALASAYNNGFGTLAAVPTNTGDGTALFTMTNVMTSTMSNTNVMYFGSGGRVVFVRPGTYFYYASANAYGTNGVNKWYVYNYHYDSSDNLKGTSGVAEIIDEPNPDGGVYIAIDADAGDYIVTKMGPASNSSGGLNGVGNRVAIGAFYRFAYKVYNSD